MKKKLILIAASLLVIVVLAAVLLSANNASKRREIAMNELLALTVKFCDEARESSDKQFISDAYDPVREKLFAARGRDDLPRDDVETYWDAAWECYRDADARATPTTQPKPPQKSDAELAAEGRSCSQQWRRARSETLSGSSNDVQLRATVYACATWDEWFLEAVENGEYSDSLLAAICTVERNAPEELCG